MKAKFSQSAKFYRRGFTLVELLVVIAIVAVLVTLSAATLRRSINSAKTVSCMAKMKNLGGSIILYTQDHNGEFPRSLHSAGANREPGWAKSIAPYLGASESEIRNSWPVIFNDKFRSPSDPSRDVNIYSYALNVYFELNPDSDDYEGAPQTWRRLGQVPSPEGTVLLAQTAPVRFGDHLMCHDWSSVQSAKNALNYEIHNGKANYLYVDGHVETLRVEQTFNPAKNINRWNPSLAR